MTHDYSNYNYNLLILDFGLFIHLFCQHINPTNDEKVERNNIEQYVKGPVNLPHFATCKVPINLSFCDPIIGSNPTIAKVNLMAEPQGCIYLGF